MFDIILSSVVSNAGLLAVIVGFILTPKFFSVLSH